MSKPVQMHQTVEVLIGDVAGEGDGVGRFQDFVIFVPGTAPGDVAKVTITEIKRSYARAELEEVLSRGRSRQDPECELAEACGGCTFQHLRYPFQLDLKRDFVRDALNHIGDLDHVAVEETVGMETPWHYRNKGRFLVSSTADSVQVGYRRPKSHQLVRVDHCLLTHARVNSLLSDLQERLPTIAGKRPTCADSLREVVIRTAFGEEESLLIFLTDGRWSGGEKFAEDLMEDHGHLVGVVKQSQVIPKDDSESDEVEVLCGRDHYWESLLEKRLRISAPSFFQVNPRQTEKLYRWTADFLDVASGERLLDVYSGIGSVGLSSAAAKSEIWAVESNRWAICDARANAATNRHGNFEVWPGPAEEVLPAMKDQGFDFDKVVVDPPRGGCQEEVLKSICQFRPQRFVYISCNAATLARDLNMMTEQGLEIARVVPLDMFPHTPHVEVFAAGFFEN